MNRYAICCISICNWAFIKAKVFSFKNRILIMLSRIKKCFHWIFFSSFFWARFGDNSCSCSKKKKRNSLYSVHSVKISKKILLLLWKLRFNNKLSTVNETNEVSGLILKLKLHTLNILLKMFTNFIFVIHANFVADKSTDGSPSRFLIESNFQQISSSVK